MSRGEVSRKRRHEAGFSLVEISCSLTLLVVSVLGTVATFSRARDLERSTSREERLHHRALAEIEQLRGGDLETTVIEMLAERDSQRDDRSYGDKLDPIALDFEFPDDLLAGVIDKSAYATFRWRDLDGDGRIDLDVTAESTRTLFPLRVTVRQDGSTLTSTTMVMQ